MLEAAFSERPGEQFFIEWQIEDLSVKGQIGAPSGVAEIAHMDCLAFYWLRPHRVGTNNQW